MLPTTKRVALFAVALTLTLAPSRASLLWGAQAPTAPSPIKLATIATPGLKVYKSLQGMREKLQKVPGGSVALEIYSPKGGESAIVSKLRGDASQYQAALLTVSGLAEIDDSVTALEDLPFMFRSLDEVEHIRKSLTPDIEKKFAEKGFVVLFWSDLGWVRFFSRLEMVHPEDLRRMPIFTTAGNAAQKKIMDAARFQPVPLTTDDLLPGLQNKQIDVVPTSPVVANGFQLATVTKHMLEINYAPLVGGAVIKKKTWDSLSTAAQDALRKAAEETGREIQLQGRAENDEAVRAMVEKQKLIVHPVTPAIEAEWQAVADKMYPEIRGGIIPAVMFDRVVALLKEYRARPRAGK